MTTATAPILLPRFAGSPLKGLLAAVTLVITTWPPVLADGFEPRHVAGLQSVTSAVISPDGRSIAYLRAVPRRPMEDPEGKTVAFLAPEEVPKEIRELREQGFNQKIYEEDYRNVGVWIVRPDDQDSEARRLELPGSASELHWSPVDGRLALALAPTPLVDDDLMMRRVHVVDAETGEVLARIENAGTAGGGPGIRGLLSQLSRKHRSRGGVRQARPRRSRRA